MLQPSVCADNDLTISIKRGTTRLSPGEALNIAEPIRASTRRMILEEQAEIARHEARVR